MRNANRELVSRWASISGSANSVPERVRPVRAAHTTCTDTADSVSWSDRARAHVVQYTCASIYRRAAQREGRRRRTGDAGKRRAGEGCGSVPAPQQHGCRRSSRAQGLDARPVAKGPLPPTEAPIVCTRTQNNRWWQADGGDGHGQTVAPTSGCANRATSPRAPVTDTRGRQPQAERHSLPGGSRIFQVGCAQGSRACAAAFRKSLVVLVSPRASRGCAV